MTDPLDALRTPADPVDPDPTFAAQLRERLRAALLAGGDMTETQHETDLAWGPTLTPYLIVADGRRALDWYADVFGARRRGEPYVMPGGSIGHAELAIGDAVLMLAEPSAGAPVQAPEGGLPSTSVHVQVPDVDRTVRHAAEAGATIQRRPEDQPYGRVAVLVDPFGHRWMLNQPPPTATRLRQGDVAYVSVLVPDDATAREFYGAVLGWRFSPGSVEHGWQVEDVTPHVGIARGKPEVQLCYHVTDVLAGTARVREHGGTAGEIARRPYGLLVDCTDPSGAHFQLWQPGG
ncbi:MAG TPA: VOC family protein [Mycobacteriales bacterium]